MKKMQKIETMSPMNRMMIQTQNPKLVLKKKSVQKNSTNSRAVLRNKPRDRRFELID